MNKKLQNLYDYCTGIYNKENGTELYNKYFDDIKSITPQELMFIQNEQLKNGLTPNEILTIVDKLINVFYESLSKYKLAEPVNYLFIHYLNEENKALANILNNFKSIIKTEKLSDNKKLLDFILQMKDYNDHLLKLENILFPYLEKRDERFDGLQILWALHDQTRNLIKSIEHDINTSNDNKTIKQKIAQLYFKLFGLVQKQELILFPSAVKFLSDYEFSEMHNQSFDYGFPYIEPPHKEIIDNKQSDNTINSISNIFITDTGLLNFEQLSLMLNALPLDITYVNEKDEVAYFSNPENRIFPRSKAAIGRNVRNCHPPKSVHIVEKILASFKNNEKDIATFWINVKGFTVLIKYICLRNSKGEYKGTLEVVQEINDIKSIEGEKRLLDWD
ncbi:MAG: PAS domain-containing protein [Eubacteriales bacterium]